MSIMKKNSISVAFATFLTASLLLATATDVKAASFDCAMASSRIDNAICASPQVSKLDSDLDGAYKAALARNSNPDGVKLAQRSWLKETRNACQNEGCLVNVYTQRIAALSVGLQPSVANAASRETPMPSRAEVESDDANIPSAADLLARESAEKAKQAAEQAAAAAEAQKVAEQAAAAASAAQAQKLAEQAAADVRRKAEDQRLMLMAGGGVAVLFALAFCAWFLLRRRRNAKNAKSVAVSKRPVDTRARVNDSEVIRQVHSELNSGQLPQPKQQPMAPSMVEKSTMAPLLSGAVTQDEKPIFCGACGSKLTEGAKNCGSCGKAVSSSVNIINQQTVDDAKKKLASATSAIVKASIKAAEQFHGEVKGINEARKNSFEEGKEINNKGKIEQTKAPSVSFWGKLTGKQKGIVIGGLLIVLFLGSKLTSESTSSGDYRNRSNNQITQDPAALVQEAGETFQRIHNIICTTPVSSQVQQCVLKNPNQTGVTAWCLNIVRQLRQNEGC